MGNSTATNASKKTGMKVGRNLKVYRTFYTNAASTSGNCKVSCSPLSLSTDDGTYTYRKGSHLIKWVNDAGSKTYIFSLRDMTSESVSRGVHLLTFSRGK